MTLDLNYPDEITEEAVSAFIASVDDSIHRQVRVTEGGIAFISDSVGQVSIEGLAFRLETWGAGNDYLGRKAASDADWVGRVRQALLQNWPNPKSTYIDRY